MAVYAARKSSAPVLRSTSPSGRSNHHSSVSASNTPSAFISSTRSLRTPICPTRVLNIQKCTSPSLSVFSVDKAGSPIRSISMSTTESKPPPSAASAPKKRTCMCAPTNHPGSFRCSLHRSGSSGNNKVYSRTNSLGRIGSIEGFLLKRALTVLIQPSSHHQRPLGEFRRRPSRLSAMSKA